jgi:integrase
VNTIIEDVETITEESHLLPNSDADEAQSSSRSEMDAFQSDEWLFKDPQSDKFFRRDMSDPEINNHWKQIRKQFVRYKLGGFKAVERYLSAIPSQVKIIMNNCTGFLRWATIHYPDTDLVQFTETDIHSFVHSMFGDNNAYGTMKTKTQMLRDSCNAYRHRHISDGLLFSIDCMVGERPKANSILKDLCDEFGLDFAEWGAGGSHGSIPVYVAMPFLAYAVRDLRSDKTKFAVSLCGLIRKYDKVGDRQRFSQAVNACFDFYEQHQRTGDLDFFAFFNPRSGGTVHSDKLRKYYYACKAEGKECVAKEAYYALDRVHHSVPGVQRRLDASSEIWDYYWDLFNDFASLADQYLTDEKCWGDVKSHIHLTVRYAALTAMLCLTGSRSWSEICNMRNKDVVADQDNPDSVFYTTPIKKTNFGIEEVRVTHNLVLEAAETLKLCRLNFDENIYLFSNDFLGIKQFSSLDSLKRLTASRLSDGLKEYYACFTEAHPEVGKEHPYLKAHQFRHTWAEFALRMFEGNVTEEIRRHFMHSYSSYMTQEYTFNKLKAEIADDLVKKYLREILGRIVTEDIKSCVDEDFEKDLQGIAVDYLSNSMNNVVVTPDTLENFLDDVADEYVHVKAHEYGYCLSRVAFIKFNNCYDKEKGMPDYDGACYSTCVGCISFCASKKNNEAALIRQSIAHTEFAKNRIAILDVTEDDKYVQESLKAAKEGKAILNRWKAKK